MQQKKGKIATQHLNAKTIKMQSGFGFQHKEVLQFVSTWPSKGKNMRKTMNLF